MGKPMIRILSIFLTVALLIGMLPMEVLGEECRQIVDGAKQASAMSRPALVEEVPGKRGMAVKEFQLDGGLHLRVVYPGTTYTAYNLHCDGEPYSINPNDYKRTFICAYRVGG